MKLDTNNHSVFLMHDHLVMVIKYRRFVLDEPISNRAKEIFAYIAPVDVIRTYIEKQGEWRR